MNNLPLISVIIPCYNTEKFVELAVRSIMEQTYRNLEIIVINDCSLDQTGEILRSLRKEDGRILYIENEVNLKLPKTLNKGISLAQGKYIARMDADDISLPNRLEKQLHFLLQNPQIDICGGNVQIVNEQGILEKIFSSVPLVHRTITKQLVWKTTLMHPTVFAKKSFFTDLNGYQDILYGEDYDMWIRGWIAGKKYANLKEVLLYYRTHNQQMSGTTFSKKNSRSVQKFLLKYFWQTKNIGFLLGFLVQTRLVYSIIRYTYHFRKKLKVKEF